MNFYNSWEGKKKNFSFKRDDEVDRWGESRTGKLWREKKMSKSVENSWNCPVSVCSLHKAQFVCVTQNWRDIPTSSDEIKPFFYVTTIFLQETGSSYIVLRTWLALFLPICKNKVVSLNIKDKKNLAKTQRT